MSATFLAFGGWEACCILILRFATRALATCVCPDGWYDAGEGLFIFIFFAYLCFWVNTAITADLQAGSTEYRCLHMNHDLTYCVQLYFASNFVDLPFFIRDASQGLRPVKDTIIMFGHHTLSSICFFGALYTDKMYFFAVYALRCEHTTVLVGLRRIILPFKKGKNSKLLSVLDLVIMLSYVKYRLYLFGMWFWYAWMDGVCLRHAEGRLENGLFLFYTPVIFFLLLISVWWLRTMLSKSGARIIQHWQVLARASFASLFEKNE